MLRESLGLFMLAIIFKILFCLFQGARARAQEEDKSYHTYCQRQEAEAHDGADVAHKR